MATQREITLHVTQDCIDRATPTPQNCPMARAAVNAGVRYPYVGYAHISGHDEGGRPLTIPVTTEMHVAIRRFDTNAMLAPASFTTTAHTRR